MADIRASEINKRMRIREYGGLEQSGLRVAKVKRHGDTVLITGEDGEETSFDIDTVVEVVVKLVCPICGSGDDLVSWEMEPAGYSGTRFYQDPDHPDKPEFDYENASTKYGDCGSGFLDDIQCNNHMTLTGLTIADLVPEGTPPNLEWKPPADRPVKISDQSAMDQIAALLRDKDPALWMIDKVAEIVSATGRGVEETPNV